MRDPHTKATMQDSLAAILGRVPSGIFILTVRQGDQETGMLASWVMQAGFEPPAVTVAVKTGRYVEEWITAGALFNLNVVAADQKNFLAHFGRGFEPGEPAFEGLDVQRCSRNVPILTEALGHLECGPVNHVDSTDHRIFLAEVTGGRLAHELTPMTHIRTSGARY